MVSAALRAGTPWPGPRASIASADPVGWERPRHSSSCLIRPHGIIVDGTSPRGDVAIRRPRPSYQFITTITAAMIGKARATYLKTGCAGSLTTRRTATIDTACTARNGRAARRTAKMISRHEIGRRAYPHNHKNGWRTSQSGVASPVCCADERSIPRIHQPVSRGRARCRQPCCRRIVRCASARCLTSVTCGRR